MLCSKAVPEETVIQYNYVPPFLLGAVLLSLLLLHSTVMRNSLCNHFICTVWSIQRGFVCIIQKFDLYFMHT